MDDQPPLIWPQFESTGYTRRRSPIPTMLGPAMIGVISAASFLLLVNFVVPPFLSITSQILQPATVKRGWDSINVVLVVFAILCGVLARRNDDGSQPSHCVEEGEAVTSGEMTVGEDSKISSTSTVSQQWFDDVYGADRLKIYESVSSRSFSPGLPVTGTVPLRRSSTSYPDLRQGVFRETGDRRFRFYDDFEIDKYRSHDSSSYEQFPNRSKTEIEEESEPKEILVDKFVVKPSSPPPQQPPAPAPPPPPPPRPSPVEVSQKPRRTHRSVRNRDLQEYAKRSDTNSDSTKFKRRFQPPPSPPPPPPPPPPPLITATPPRKQGSLQRRKSNAAKEIKMVFASLYNQGKRKKKLQKSKRKERSSESLVVVDVTEPSQYQSLISPPSPPPPPPPPLPPPPRSSQSVFYGLFKKGVKSNKKIHSVPAPPPPPPPRKTQLDPQTPPRRVKSGRPPRPTKPTNFNEESYVNNGQGSPIIQITPPPPPPPPFRVPPLKFVVSGDFAKIRSNQSSRCSSPEREVIDLGWGLELTQSDGGVETIAAVGGPGFCPSPDVNTKADNFIARLRDEWRLDKINSVNRKR